MSPVPVLRVGSEHRAGIQWVSLLTVSRWFVGRSVGPVWTEFPHPPAAWTGDLLA
jgi:hypothetical protein